MTFTAAQKSLKKWTKQKWRTRSGRPSVQGPLARGERYMPAKAVKSLTAAEHAATTDKKQKDTPNTPCLLYTSPSPRDRQKSRMPSSA